VNCSVIEPPLFAVSGGSYLGAALALLRRFTYAVPPQQPDPSIGWADSYRPGSVELERLRRHTRYLFEPVTRWRDGLVALVLGATLNVVIVGLVLLIFTWVSATLAVLVGMSRVQRSGVDGPPLDVLWASGWSTRDWLVVLVPSLGCLAGILWLTWRDWVVTSAFDDVGQQGAGQQVVELGAQQKKMRERVTVWRQALLALGVAWLVMTAGLPAATKGITWLTTHDKPTATAAGVLNGLGFGVKGTCTQAMVENLQDAVSRVSDEARISPDVPRTIEVTGSISVQFSPRHGPLLSKSVRVQFGDGGGPFLARCDSLDSNVRVAEQNLDQFEGRVSGPAEDCDFGHVQGSGVRGQGSGVSLAGKPPARRVS